MADTNRDWVARLGVLSTCDVGDALGRMGIVDSAIHALWSGARAIGPAFTVWTRAGDNLLVHQALERIEPGQVLVVNGQGDVNRALMGDRMGEKLLVNGGVGAVFDGAVRDAATLTRLGVPVFARAVTPAGPFKHGPGSMGVPIAVGGVVVNPGDMVVADDNGVVVIPAGILADVVARAEVIAADEEWPVPADVLAAEGGAR